MISMARGNPGSLLVPLVLAVLVALLLYFYWGASSELRGLRSKKIDLDRDVLAARSELENLQYQFKLIKEDMDSASSKVEMAGREMKAMEEKEVRSSAPRGRAARSGSSVCTDSGGRCVCHTRRGLAFDARDLLPIGSTRGWCIDLKFPVSPCTQKMKVFVI